MGLVVTGLLQLYSSDGLVTKTSWGVSLLGLILTIVAFFTVTTSPAIRKETPAFVWVAASFLIYAVSVSFVQWYSWQLRGRDCRLVVYNNRPTQLSAAAPSVFNVRHGPPLGHWHAGRLQELASEILVLAIDSAIVLVRSVSAAQIVASASRSRVAPGCLC